MVVHVPVTLYSVTQALAFLRDKGLDRSDTWLRNRMRSERLQIYRIGNSAFITEADLLLLLELSKPERGRKRKGEMRGNTT